MRRSDGDRPRLAAIAGRWFSGSYDDFGLAVSCRGQAGVARPGACRSSVRRPAQTIVFSAQLFATLAPRDSPRRVVTVTARERHAGIANIEVDVAAISLGRARPVCRGRHQAVGLSSTKRSTRSVTPAGTCSGGGRCPEDVRAVRGEATPTAPRQARYQDDLALVPGTDRRGVPATFDDDDRIRLRDARN